MSLPASDDDDTLIICYPDETHHSCTEPESNSDDAYPFSDISDDIVVHDTVRIENPIFDSGPEPVSHVPVRRSVRLRSSLPRTDYDSTRYSHSESD